VPVGQKIGMIGAEEEAREAVKPPKKKPQEEKAVAEEEVAAEKEKEEEPKKPKEPEPTKEIRKPPEEERKPRPEVEVHMESREAIERFVARRAPAKVSASPVARELAQKHKIDLSEIEGSGPDGEIVKRDVEKVIAQKEKRPPTVEVKHPKKAINATPLAVVLAEKEGVDLEEVKGTGIGGRIRESDVKAYVARRCAQRGEEYQELSLMRKTIARRMTESKKTIPHFYLTMPVDMGAVMQLRKKINEGKKDDEKVSVNDIIVKAAALALQEMPLVNASFSDDKIKMNKNINVGVATATPDGLVVPVIPDANKKPVAIIAAETRDKIERAKKRKLKPEEYSNATFTVSNLGMFGIEHFSAIIDPGQSAILAVGAVAKQPVAVDDRVEVKQIMRMTLSCDHRVVDGYTGTQYLVKLREILESPEKAIG
jgi:pyruvate dehydrogenase E2 component (dihydrolipoamide acetyltransferase)